MSISEIRGDARKALTGKWGKGALITLAYLAFYLVVGFVQSLFGEESLISNLIGIAIIVIQIPISLGLIFAFIKLKRDEEIKAFDFLDIGFSNFGKAWKITLRTALKMILPIIGMIISMFIFSYAIMSFVASAILGGTGEVSISLFLIGGIIYVISLICLLIVGLLYSLTWYIAYDNPEMSALEVVNKSAEMMKGNRGKLFLLQLSFIGWIILSVFTLGIGCLWLLPYMQIAIVCFYEKLLDKNQDNIESNDEVIQEY